MQHILGVGIGGIATLILLWLFAPPTAADSNVYLISVIVGAIVALAWPWVIGLFLVRRARARRDDQIQKEVDKQISQQSK